MSSKEEAATCWHRPTIHGVYQVSKCNTVVPKILGNRLLLLSPQLFDHFSFSGSVIRKRWRSATRSATSSGLEAGGSTGSRRSKIGNKFYAFVVIPKVSPEA